MLVSVLIFISELNFTFLVSTTLALVLVVTRYGTGASLRIFYKPWKHWNYFETICLNKTPTDHEHITANPSLLDDKKGYQPLNTPCQLTSLGSNLVSNNNNKMLVENILIQESMLFGKIRPKKDGTNLDPPPELSESLPSIIIDSDIEDNFLVEELNSLASMIDDAGWLRETSPQPLVMGEDEEEEEEDDDEVVSGQSSQDDDSASLPSIFTSSSSSHSLISSAFSSASIQSSLSTASLEGLFNAICLKNDTDEEAENKEEKGREPLVSTQGEGSRHYIPSTVCHNHSVETGATHIILNGNLKVDEENRLSDSNGFCLHNHHHYHHNRQQSFHITHNHPHPPHITNQETVDGLGPKSVPLSKSVHHHKHKRRHSTKCSHSTLAASQQNPNRHSPPKSDKKSRKVRNPLKKINKTVSKIFWPTSSTFEVSLQDSVYLFSCFSWST